MQVCRASDIMIRIEDYPTVPPRFTLGAAIEMMEDSAYDLACANGRSSLPRVLLVVLSRFIWFIRPLMGTPTVLAAKP